MRYKQPYRRFFLRVCSLLPHDSWAREKLLEWLYPTDARMTFK